MQIASVETNAGTAIWAAPSRIAWVISLFWARLRLMFSISTVASSTRMPTARANPPSVMMLIVSPRAERIRSDIRIESGIETAMISVLRQLPRKSRIISPVRHAAMRASLMTPLMEARTKRDWSATGVIVRFGGSESFVSAIVSRTRLMMSSVDAAPVFRMVSSDARCPSTRTMLVCGG